jgi:2-aminoethylphosphonate-pyruvate transaminase
MTSESVRQAAAVPDMSHRDPAYLELVGEVKHRLLQVYPGLANGWEALLIGGSGTAAVEAMLTSCVGDGPVLVIENGYYSGRFSEILGAHSIPHKVLRFGWLEPWDMEAIERELEGVEAVVGTHNETTTGRLNPVGRLAKICAKRGIRCLIDAVSSFGADTLDFSHIDAVATSANKCLHGLPGLSIVLVRSVFLEKMKVFPKRSFYLHLPIYAGDYPPLTPPIPSVSALRQALRETSGAEVRGRVYAKRAAEIRSALLTRGLTFAVPDLEASCTLTTASLPGAYSSESWLAANRENGFVLYPCKGELRDRFFQVANMGELTDQQIQAWIESLDALI